MIKRGTKFKRYRGALASQPARYINNVIFIFILQVFCSLCVLTNPRNAQPVNADPTSSDLNLKNSTRLDEQELLIRSSANDSNLLALRLSSEPRSAERYESSQDHAQIRSSQPASLTTSEQLRKLLLKPSLILSSFVPHILSKQLVLKRPDHQSNTLGLRRLNGKLLHSKRPPRPTGRPVDIEVPFSLQPVRLAQSHLLAVSHMRPMLLDTPHRRPLAKSRPALVNPGRLVLLHRIHPVAQPIPPRVPVTSRPLHETVAGEPTQARPAFVSLIEDDESEDEDIQEGHSEPQVGIKMMPNTRSESAELGLNQIDQLIKDEYESRLNLNRQILSMNLADTNSSSLQPEEDYSVSSTSASAESEPMLPATMTSWPAMEESTTVSDDSPWWVPSRYPTSQLLAKLEAPHLSTNVSVARLASGPASNRSISESRVPAESSLAELVVDRANPEESGGVHTFKVPDRVNQTQQSPFRPTALETISQLKLNNNQQLSNHSSGRAYERLRLGSNSQVRLTGGTVRTTLAPDNLHQMRNLNLESGAAKSIEHHNHHRESIDRRRPWEFQATTGRPSETAQVVNLVPSTSVEPGSIDQLRWRDPARQADGKSSATSLLSLNDTLRRLRETKKRIHKLQVQLNSTTGAFSANSVPVRPVGFNQGVADSSADMDDEDEFSSSNEEEELEEPPAKSHWINGSLAEEDLFARWSPGKLSKPAGSPLIRAHQALNLPLSLYHGNPLTAPARLMVSALAQGPHLKKSAGGLGAPSLRPIVLSSTLRVTDEPRSGPATSAFRLASPTTTSNPSFYVPADKSSLTVSGKNLKEVLNGTHREPVKQTPVRQQSAGTNYAYTASSQRPRFAHPHDHAESGAAHRLQISSLLQAPNNDNNRQPDTMKVATNRSSLLIETGVTTKPRQVATSTLANSDMVTSGEAMADKIDQNISWPSARHSLSLDKLGGSSTTTAATSAAGTGANSPGQESANNKTSIAWPPLLAAGDSSKPGWQQVSSRPAANQSHPTLEPEASKPASLLERIFAFLAGSGPTGSDRTSSVAGPNSRQTANSSTWSASGQFSEPKPDLPDERLTTERVLQWLIGFSCTLALVCLCIIAALLKCRAANSRSTSSSASSSRALVLGQTGLSSTDWRRKLTGRNLISSDQRRDQLILDGTMRNVSLLSKQQHMGVQNLSLILQQERLLQLSKDSSTGSGPASLPQPRFNRSCCHCVNCSESWLFHDAQSNERNGRANPTFCPSGFYHPAPRGKLPFGAASSVNKFLNLSKLHVQPGKVKPQDCAKTSVSIENQRQPIGGTRMRMMSAIEERTRKQTNSLGCSHDHIAAACDCLSQQVANLCQDDLVEEQLEHQLQCDGSASCRLAVRRFEQQLEASKQLDRCSACGESVEASQTNDSPEDNVTLDGAVLDGANNLCKSTGPSKATGCRVEHGMSENSIDSSSAASLLVELPQASTGAISGSAASACSKLYRANKADLNYSQFRRSRDKFSRAVSICNASQAGRLSQNTTSAKAKAFHPHEHKEFKNHHQQVDGRTDDQVAAADKLPSEQLSRRPGVSATSACSKSLAANTSANKQLHKQLDGRLIEVVDACNNDRPFVLSEAEELDPSQAVANAARSSSSDNNRASRYKKQRL